MFEISMVMLPLSLDRLRSSRVFDGSHTPINTLPAEANRRLHGDSTQQLPCQAPSSYDHGKLNERFGLVMKLKHKKVYLLSGRGSSLVGGGLLGGSSLGSLLGSGLSWGSLGN